MTYNLVFSALYMIRFGLFLLHGLILVYFRCNRILSPLTMPEEADAGSQTFLDIRMICISDVRILCVRGASVTGGQWQDYTGLAARRFKKAGADDQMKTL